MPLFKMLDHYELSEMQAAVVNAMIAAFIETLFDWFYRIITTTKNPKKHGSVDH
jgi:capsid protein